MQKSGTYPASAATTQPLSSSSTFTRDGIRSRRRGPGQRVQHANAPTFLGSKCFCLAKVQPDVGLDRLFHECALIARKDHPRRVGAATRIWTSSTAYPSTWMEVIRITQPSAPHSRTPYPRRFPAPTAPPTGRGRGESV